MDRGKVLHEEDLEQLKGDWGRYRDVDGDGIPYRTLPGNRHQDAAYFTRGTGHTEDARYSEDSQVWHDLLIRLKKKYKTGQQHVPGPIFDRMDGAEIGLISFGSTEPGINEARQQLAQLGMNTDFMRIRAVPFNYEIGDFIRAHQRCYVIEMNRDGQMHQLLTLEYPDQAMKLTSLAYIDGLPLTARYVRQAILAKEERLDE